MKKQKQKLFKLLVRIFSIFSAIYAINRLIFYFSTKHEKLFSKHGQYYKHKHGNIFYTKTGQGTPLLLLHDLDCCSSEYEWHKVVQTFAKKYTVYTVDLLGCGRSDKPRITYTSYLYVQILTDFICNIIGEQPDVIATGNSVPITIMIEKFKKNTFSHMIFVNPVDFYNASKMPSKRDLYLKYLLELPIVGTFIYCCHTTSSTLWKRFYTKYLATSPSDTLSYLARYHEAAHLKGSASKYLFSSQVCNFLGCNVIDKYIDISTPTCVILGEFMEYQTDISDWSIFLNSNTEVAIIPNCKFLPQIEKSEEFSDICETYLENGTIE